ncbi:MAG: hypothetical protein HZC40_23210 [Chloroflexi bacterium]|nr:hypothetical protein [Chloroflexota bacterium]
MSHHIEVDQSGRTDRFNEDTALAFSDGIQCAILLSAAVKRECYQKLRERNLSKKVAAVTIFAAGLVILCLAIHTWRGDSKPNKKVSVEELLRAC